MNIALKKTPLILKNGLEKSVKEENLSHHPSFPHYGLSEKRLEHIHIIKDELEVKPEFADVFVESFCTPSIPSVWCYEFEHQSQSYLIAQLGPRFVIATHNFSADVSEDFEFLYQIPLDVYEGKIPNTQKTADFYNETLRQYVVEKINRIKHHDFSFFRGFEEHPKPNPHYPKHVYDGALSLNPFSGIFNQQASYIQDEFVFLWETFISKANSGPFNTGKVDASLFINSTKHLRQRYRFSGSIKQVKHHRARMGTILKKIRHLYDKDVITVLYRVHFFNLDFANWLAHPDPTIRLYRQQAAQSHSFLIAYFHLYLHLKCKNTPNDGGVSEPKPYFDSNSHLTEIMQSEHKKEVENLQLIFSKIDTGHSLDDLIYEAICMTSPGLTEFSPSLFYASEMEQLLKTGIRRFKKIKLSLLGVLNRHGNPSDGNDTLDRYIKGMIIQLACIENKHPVHSKKNNLAMVDEFIKNLQKGSTPNSVGYLEPFFLGLFPSHVYHPYKKAPLSFKNWFNMVYKQATTQDPSSWSLSDTLNFLQDTLRTTYSYDPDYSSYSLRAVIFSLFAKHSLASIAHYVQDLHALEARTREQYRLENRKANHTSWEPLLKEKALEFNSHITIRELTTSDELFLQGQDQDHCVGGYTSLCVQGHCRIFSIIENGNPISTLCLNNSFKGDSNFWRISQNYASRNQDPPPMAVKAASFLIKIIKKEPERINFIHIATRLEIQQNQAEEDMFIKKALHEHSRTHFPSIHFDFETIARGS